MLQRSLMAVASGIIVASVLHLQASASATTVVGTRDSSGISVRYSYSSGAGLLLNNNTPIPRTEEFINFDGARQTIRSSASELCLFARENCNSDNRIVPFQADMFALADLSAGRLSVAGTAVGQPTPVPTVGTFGGAGGVASAAIFDEISFVFDGGGVREVTLLMTITGFLGVSNNSPNNSATVIASLGLNGVTDSFDVSARSNGGDLDILVDETISVSLDVTSGVEYILVSSLATLINADSGSTTADFGNSALLQLQVPEGVSYMSGSGIFLEGVSEVPLPPAIAFLAPVLAFIVTRLRAGRSRPATG